MIVLLNKINSYLNKNLNRKKNIVYSTHVYLENFCFFFDTLEFRIKSDKTLFELAISNRTLSDFQIRKCL